MSRSVAFVTTGLLLAPVIISAPLSLPGYGGQPAGARRSAPLADGIWLSALGEWLDQSAVVAIHSRREPELGDNASRWRAAYLFVHEYMLWPDDTARTRLAVGPERTAAARRQCVHVLRRALKPEYVPDGLSDHLVGIRGHGTSGSDFLLGRYAAGEWKFQIIHSGRATGILCVPRDAAATAQPSGRYALEVARAVLVEPRPQDEADVEALDMGVEEVFQGSIFNPNARSIDDPLIGPSPWYGFRTITDGRYVFMQLPAWALEPDVDLTTRPVRKAMRPDDTVRLFE